MVAVVRNLSVNNDLIIVSKEIKEIKIHTITPSLAPVVIVRCYDSGGGSGGGCERGGSTLSLNLTDDAKSSPRREWRKV